MKEQIKKFESSGADAAMIGILKSLCSIKGKSLTKTDTKSVVESLGVDPLDLDTVQHTLKVRYDELVKNKDVKPATSKDLTTYFVSPAGGRTVSNNPKKKDDSPPKLTPRGREDRPGKDDKPKKNNGGKPLKKRFPCYLCDSLEHFLVDCPLKQKVKELMSQNKVSGESEEPKAVKGDDKKLKKTVGFSGHVSGLSFHIAEEMVRFDPQLFLDDNGSNTDIVNDESLLVEVQPVDAFVGGVGSAKVTGIGVFVGKSVNRDGSTVSIARKRVLVCPSFNRNIIGTSVLQRRDDVEDETLRYDLYDNPEDSSDPFLYFQLVPLDDDELSEEHRSYIETASADIADEVRAFQAQAYQAELKKAKKKVKFGAVSFEPTPTAAVKKVIDKVEKAVHHAHAKGPSPQPAIRKVRKDDLVDDMSIKASINTTTTVGDIVADGNGHA